MSERDIAEACRELAAVLNDSIADPTPVVYAIRNLIEEIVNERSTKVSAAGELMK